MSAKAQQSAGAIGLKHWAAMLGETASDPAAPVYAVCDRRANGARRIVGEYRDPDCARAAADQLRAAGSPAEVLLLTQLGDDE